MGGPVGNQGFLRLGGGGGGEGVERENLRKKSVQRTKIGGITKK